jgi:pyridoxamine 5'-phosphate oxidase
MDSLTRHTDYGNEGLTEADALADPFDLFAAWLRVAEAAEIFEPNAFVLGTIDPDGHASSRTVLLKAVEHSGAEHRPDHHIGDDHSLDEPGAFQFVTNYASRKARAIEANPSVSMLFPWYPLKRQIIVYGQGEKATSDVSDALWNRRPHGAKLASMASEQSAPVANRDVLDARLAELSVAFPPGSIAPRPANWGAFRIVPSAIEFWQGRSMRFHDRLRYERSSQGWRIIRLQP